MASMSLGDHLEELRMRLVFALAGLLVGTVIAFFLTSPVIHFMERPYLNTMQYMTDDPNGVTAISPVLQSLAPADGFISFIKIALVLGLLISSPWVFYHIWMFVAAGLYSNEKKYVYYAVPFSVILFIAGAMFFIFAVAPLTLKFLVVFNKNFLGIQSNFTFQQYMSFVTRLMLVFGIAFQTPTAIFFLNKTGLVSVRVLCKIRAYVILAIFTLSAMVTPPDIISQVTLALPLYILFELGILVSYLSNRKADQQI